MHTVGRWALRVPDGTDGPPNVPLWMDRLAVDLTDVAKDNQGTLGARQVSTALTPGVAGRYFTTTDELDGGIARRRVYRDFGLGWDELATLPVSRRMLDPAIAQEIPSALLTPAQFLALPAQPDGTVVRVHADAAAGVNWRLRLRKFQIDGVTPNPSAYKWEADGAQTPLHAVNDAIVAAPTATAGTTQSPSITLPLGGDFDVVMACYIQLPAVAGQMGGLMHLYANGANLNRPIQWYDNSDATAQRVMQHIPRHERITGRAAGDVLDARIQALNASGANIGNRRLRAAPVRVAGPAAA